MEGERLGNEGEGEVKEGREGDMKSRRDGSNEREREWRNTCTSKGENEGLKEGGGGTCIMDGGMERDSK